MPELPEVETTLRGISKKILNKEISSFISREKKLRWIIPPTIGKLVKGQRINNAFRRGKYIIFELDNCSLIIHLGMSGKLRVFNKKMKPKKHEHWDLNFTDNWTLRYTDIRKFGVLDLTLKNPLEHKLLKDLGPEPLGNSFNGIYLFEKSRKKSIAVKQFIMNAKIVVGVGNIYANEALFMAGIKPIKKAGKVTKKEYENLSTKIVKVLKDAIHEGGTTLKDYSNAEEAPGYFKKKLQVYGRGNLECFICRKNLKEIRLGNRSTVYCVSCQN